MTARSIFLAALLTGCLGCGVDNVIVAGESNYMTFEHPFTDAAAEDVRKRAERLCGQRRQAALKTSTVCSLARCTTNYQCTNDAEAATK
jgi:hypothetical protein